MADKRKLLLSNNILLNDTKIILCIPRTSLKDNLGSYVKLFKHYGTSYVQTLCCLKTIFLFGVHTSHYLITVMFSLLTLHNVPFCLLWIYTLHGINSQSFLYSNSKLRCTLIIPAQLTIWLGKRWLSLWISLHNLGRLILLIDISMF